MSTGIGEQISAESGEVEEPRRGHRSRGDRGPKGAEALEGGTGPEVYTGWPRGHRGWGV